MRKARFIFTQMLSRCVINCRQNRELEKHQGEKNPCVAKKEKVKVKLHAAVVLNITDWAIYEPRRHVEGIHSAADVARVSATE